MPDTASTLIHFTTPALLKFRQTACLQESNSPLVTDEVGQVTCFACRKSGPFLVRQGEGVRVPVPLAEIEPPGLRRLMDDVLKACRNERGMYVIEESIHHGDYRSVRRVEVYDINAVTVDAVIVSSAYTYGSWLDPDSPHATGRRPKLFDLVDDLRSLRTNRVIGWSTFRLITPSD